MTLFILVRHGQTEWNRVDRFRGRADIDLDATGLSQAVAAGRRIAAQWHPQAIYASPLRRAMQTGQVIGEHTGLPVRPHPGLLDIDFGLWQGLTPDEARASWPDLLDKWETVPGTVQVPEGERLSEVRARGMATLAELAAAHQDDTVVMVGHTVINRAILLGVLGLDDNAFWRLGQNTCAINVFMTGAQGFTLLSMNDTCHLISA
jgi:broad specificity phosphatase PhoE